MIDQMQEEIERLRAQVTRLQADSTAELLRHREERAGMLQKIQDQKNLIHDLNTRHLDDVTLAGARDRRIAALESAMNPQDIADVDAAMSNPETPSPSTCSSCAFYSERIGTGYSDCRRHAPVVITAGEWAGNDGVPSVKPDFWCGDYAALAGKGVSVDNEKLTFTLSEEAISAAAQTHDELLTARASEAMLREALEELLECARLRGDNQLPNPCDDPILWTARMQQAWDDCAEVLSGSSGEWLERKMAEAVTNYIDGNQQTCDNCGNVYISVKGTLDAVCSDPSDMEGESLCAKCWRAELADTLARAEKAEAERDELAVVMAKTAKVFCMTVDANKDCDCRMCQIMRVDAPTHLARITAEARRKALLEAVVRINAAILAEKIHSHNWSASALVEEMASEVDHA